MSDWTEVLRCRIATDDVARAARLLGEYLGMGLRERRSGYYARPFYSARTEGEDVLLLRNEDEDGQPIYDGFPFDAVVLVVGHRAGAAESRERVREIERAVKRAAETE